MKLLLSLLGFFWAYTSIAQSDNPFLSIWNETKPVQQVVTIHREPLVATAPPELVTFAYLADPVDSLVAKRSMFTTAIYKDTVRLSTAAVRSLYQSNPKAIQKLRWGNILKPIGPLMIVSGIAIAYIGIRGEQKMDYIRGIGTKAQPNVPDVLVDYTKRSLPKTLLGLGLFIGAFYVIERSNELTAMSVKLYNAKPASIRNLSHVDHIKLGITTTGNIGLEARF